jgi:hypothetical protein
MHTTYIISPTLVWPAMDFARVIPISDESISAELTAFTFQYGKKFCEIEGQSQLLREAEDTIVGLLHLVPASSTKFAYFRRIIHPRSETPTQIEASDTDDSDGIATKNSAMLEGVIANADNHIDLGMKASSTTPTKLILKSFRDYDVLA